MTIDGTLRLQRESFLLDVDFSVPHSGVTAIFGPSGSGKTTLLRAIAGLEPQAQGRLTVGDSVWQDARMFVPPHKRALGYVFQESSLFQHLTVENNLRFGFKRTQKGTARVAFDEAVSLLELDDLLPRRPAELSGGERQRAAIARALLAGPELLLMDEPLAALDQRRKGDILPYLERLYDELDIPVFYVSHSIDEVARLADQIVVLNKGRVAASGAIQDVMTRLDLFPLTGRFEASALVEAEIVGHAEGDYLTEVRFDDGRLWLSAIDAPVGTPVRLRVRARDVLLALSEPEMISANNVLAGRVAELRSDIGGHVDVLVACGQTRLLARITHRSKARLGIEPGRDVYAVIKSVNLDRHGGQAQRNEP